MSQAKITKSGSARKKRSPNTPPTGPARFLDGKSNITIADHVYSQLHRSIVSLDLKPGSPISEQEIAQAEGVSRTPVREAILRLSKECLVEVVPKSGTYVGRIPLASLPEALIAKSSLEQVTINAAAQRSTPSQIMKLKASLEEQREAANDNDYEGFNTAGEAFHELIAGIAGYSSIWTMIKQLKVQIDRTRRLILQDDGVMEMTLEEHSLIVQAIEKNDPSIASSRMDEHMELLEKKIVEEWTKFPEYFIQD